MRTAIIILTLLIAQSLPGQDKSVTFTNYGKAYVLSAKDSFFSSKIHEITLNPDSTFEFWSRPHISCFTWNSYKGTWKKTRDTLFFADKYEIAEEDTKATYKKDARKSFFISFKTDKNSRLKNRTIQVQFIYDYNAHLEDSEKMFTLKADNTINIPFKNIPHLNKLSAIRVEYQLNDKEKRYNYLTENKTLNIKKSNVPNIINVEFVETPKREMVYRTIKGVIKNDNLVIVSISKTRSVLPDYRNIEFEDGYALHK